MELKTLKDIGEKYNLDFELDPPLKELRQEAIKWARFIQPEVIVNMEQLKKYDTVLWIMNFFNITEEELNGKDS